MAERRTTTSDGVQLSYLVQGEGFPVVLVPGLLMTAQWWVDDGYVAALADGHRVIAVDPLGVGRSDRPLDIEAYADDRLVEHLTAVIDAEAAGGAAMWGWGRGAMIAQLYARRRPTEVSLVVYAGDFLDVDRTRLAEVDVDLHADNAEVVAALEREDWDRVWRVLDDSPAWFRERVVRDTDPWVLATMLRAGARRPLGFLPSSVPTIAIWGSEAPYAELNRDLAETLPIETAEVRGDRFSIYLDVEAQMAAVGPRLAAVAERR